MNRLERAILRRAMEARYAEGGPGKMVLKVNALGMMPAEYDRLLNAIGESLELYPGVEAVEIRKQDRALVFHYDGTRTNERELYAWYGALRDRALREAEHVDPAQVTREDILRVGREALSALGKG